MTIAPVTAVRKSSSADRRAERERQDEDRARHCDDRGEDGRDRREEVRERDHVLGLGPAQVRADRRDEETGELQRDAREEEGRDEAAPAGVRVGGGAQAGFRATEDPTQVKSLLKSTPSIFPRERRQRLSASVGAAAPSGRKNIILTSTLTPPPSTAVRHGS